METDSEKWAVKMAENYKVILIFIFRNRIYKRKEKCKLAIIIKIYSVKDL